MRGLFNKSKGFIAGVVTGAVIMASVPVFANGESVTAIIDNSIRVIIAGESKTLPEEYDMLNYKGYTYLPSRYVAEALGATVTWDQGSRTITIKEPPPVEIEKIVEVEKIVEKAPEQPDANYKELPAYGYSGDIYVSLISFSRINTQGYTMLELQVNNNSKNDEYIVDLFGAKITSDGEEYVTNGVIQSTYNPLFIDNIMPEKSIRGTMNFSLVNTGTKNFTLELPVRNQSTGQVTTVTVNFTATLS